MNRAIKDIERGKQRGRAIALIIVRQGRPAAALERKPWLGPIERLDLALFIDRQHDGVGRWRDIEPDDVVEFLGEGLVVGQLEAAPTVSSQPMVVPDLHDRGRRDTDRFGHRANRPVGRLMIGRFQRQRYDLVDEFGRKRRNPWRAGPVAQQAIDALDHEAFLPAPHTGFRRGCRRHDRGPPQASLGQQNGPRAPDMLLS